MEIGVAGVVGMERRLQRAEHRTSNIEDRSAHTMRFLRSSMFSVRCSTFSPAQRPSPPAIALNHPCAITYLVIGWDSLK